jgi:DNA-binding NarL/FixJ family response regulator
LIQILLVEDHNIVRNGIRSLLDKEAGLEVVDEATNGVEVLRKLERGLRVDVILTDINMPHLSGLALADQLRLKWPEIKVLFLSMLDHENYVLEAFNTGVCGYLLKNVSEEEMVFAIRHVYAGNLYVCSELIAKLLSRLRTLIDEAKPALQNTSVELSRRELRYFT